MKRRLRIGPYLCWVSLHLRTFKEKIQAAECRLRVKTGIDHAGTACPIYPQEQTSLSRLVLSERCQQQTWRDLLDQFIGAHEY
jgi:hypothetical protein